MRIWLRANEEAHPFVPEGYWRKNFAAVRRQILQAEVYVYEESGAVRGFIGMAGDEIEGIFVEAGCRSLGIGTQLLAHVKRRHRTLSLHVYQNNKRAFLFYCKEGFYPLAEQQDEQTGQREYRMIWRAEQEDSRVWERLCTAAKQVQNARAVSDTIEAGQVAAALMTKSGNIYTGICIDTACSLGMCAERNAIAHMLTCGESEIAKLAVLLPDNTAALPCGACCELMMQLSAHAGETQILTNCSNWESRRLRELFPHWWKQPANKP